MLAFWGPVRAIWHTRVPHHNPFSATAAPNTREILSFASSDANQRLARSKVKVRGNSACVLSPPFLCTHTSTRSLLPTSRVLKSTTGRGRPINLYCTSDDRSTSGNTNNREIDLPVVKATSTGEGRAHLCFSINGPRFGRGCDQCTSYLRSRPPNLPPSCVFPSVQVCHSYFGEVGRTN